MNTEDNELLNTYPPEDIADAVRSVLSEAVNGAIENWSEGFWSDLEPDTTRADVLRNLCGYIESLLEGFEDDPDSEYSQPLMTLPTDE